MPWRLGKSNHQQTALVILCHFEIASWATRKNLTSQQKMEPFIYIIYNLYVIKKYMSAIRFPTKTLSKKKKKRIQQKKPGFSPPAMAWSKIGIISADHLPCCACNLWLPTHSSDIWVLWPARFQYFCVSCARRWECGRCWNWINQSAGGTICPRFNPVMILKGRWELSATCGSKMVLETSCFGSTSWLRLRSFDPWNHVFWWIFNCVTTTKETPMSRNHFCSAPFLFRQSWPTKPSQLVFVGLKFRPGAVFWSHSDWIHIVYHLYPIFFRAICWPIPRLGSRLRICQVLYFEGSFSRSILLVFGRKMGP